MHEYSLVDALVRRAEAEARARRATAIRRVKVTVGELAGVDPELLRSAWDLVRPGTLCAEAALEVAPVTARWTCPACGRALDRGAVLRCAACDRPARLAPGGDALLLESLDLEVP